MDTNGRGGKGCEDVSRDALRSLSTITFGRCLVGAAYRCVASFVCSRVCMCVFIATGVVRPRRHFFGQHRRHTANGRVWTVTQKSSHPKPEGLCFATMETTSSPSVAVLLGPRPEGRRASGRLVVHLRLEPRPSSDDGDSENRAHKTITIGPAQVHTAR